MIRDRKRELFEESESDINKTEDDTAMGLSIIGKQILIIIFIKKVFRRETKSLSRSSTDCRQKCGIE